MPWQEHGKSMSRAWQPRGMARAWLGQGKSKARPLPLHGKSMARTWQGLPPYPLPSHYPSTPALPPPPLPPSATSHPVGPPGQVVAHKSSTCLCDAIFSTAPHTYVVASDAEPCEAARARCTEQHRFALCAGAGSRVRASAVSDCMGSSLQLRGGLAKTKHCGRRNES
jgi:hypothetical protein